MTTTAAALITVSTARGPVDVPSVGTRFVRHTPGGWRIGGVAVSAPKLWWNDLGVTIEIETTDGKRDRIGFMAGGQTVEVVE